LTNFRLWPAADRFDSTPVAPDWSSKVGDYVLFKVSQYGGNLFVVARNFTIKPLKA